MAFQYLSGAYKQEGKHIFTSDIDRTWETDFKLKEWRISLDAKWKIFTELYHKVLREAVEVPSLEVFIGLDGDLGKQACLQQKHWNQMTFKISS